MRIHYFSRSEFHRFTGASSGEVTHWIKSGVLLPNRGGRGVRIEYPLSALVQGAIALECGRFGLPTAVTRDVLEHHRYVSTGARYWWPTLLENAVDKGLSQGMSDDLRQFFTACSGVLVEALQQWRLFVDPATRSTQTRLLYVYESFLQQVPKGADGLQKMLRESHIGRGWPTLLALRADEGFAAERSLVAIRVDDIVSRLEERTGVRLIDEQAALAAQACHVAAAEVVLPCAG